MVWHGTRVRVGWVGLLAVSERGVGGSQMRERDVGMLSRAGRGGRMAQRVHADSKRRTLSGEHAWASVSGGFYHTCGVTTAREAYCWGRNGYGELGGGNHIQNRDKIDIRQGSRSGNLPRQGHLMIREDYCHSGSDRRCQPVSKVALEISPVAHSWLT